MSNLPTIKNSSVSMGALDIGSIIRPINCVLTQATSKVPDNEKGKFKFSTGELRDELKQVVVLAVQPSRVLYGKVLGGDPRCASDDGVHIAKRIKDPVHAGCNGCPMAQWELNPEKTKMSIELGKVIKPAPLCRNQYMLLILDQGSLVPYWLAVHDAQMKTVQQQLLTGALHRGCTETFMVAVDIKITTKTGKGNAWHEVYFSNMTKLEDFTHYQEMAMRYVAKHTELMDQEFSERAEAKDDIPF